MPVFKLSEFPALARIVRAAEPGYRKATAILCVYPRIEITGTYWDSGSRDHYTLVELLPHDTYGVRRLYGASAPPQFGGREPAPVELTNDIAVVSCGIFRGKPAHARLYVNPNTLARLAPALASEVTQ
jgi:hypothetical protein